MTGLYEVGLLMVGFGFGSLFQWVKERINNALDNSTPRSSPQATSEGQPVCTCDWTGKPWLEQYRKQPGGAHGTECPLFLYRERVEG